MKALCLDFTIFLYFFDSDWIRPLRNELFGYFFKSKAVLLISLLRDSQVESCHFGFTTFLLVFFRNFQFLPAPLLPPLKVIEIPLFAAFSAEETKNSVKNSVVQSTYFCSPSIPFVAKFLRNLF